MAPHYQDLEEGSFRLLLFLDDSGLSCNLQAYKLDEAPRYIALSYTWGRASYQKGRSSLLTYSITLNGEHREVQQNLHDALRHLGRLVRERQCLFWVDAICINQEDVNERNAQVKKMKDIYEYADRIYAWLGMHNDEIDAVLATVTKSHAGFPINNASQAWIAWDGIAEMFNQSYWHRVWIYQEATTP
ncbi:HET-domain-containing protein, partial [Glonium stellatum]